MARGSSNDSKTGPTQAASYKRFVIGNGLSCNQRTPDSWSKCGLCLISQAGRLLNRLLDRFQFVATYPDPRLSEFVPNLDDVAKLEYAFRVPFLPYWGRVLTRVAHPSSRSRETRPADGRESIQTLAPNYATRMGTGPTDAMASTRC